MWLSSRGYLPCTGSPRYWFLTSTKTRHKNNPLFPNIKYPLQWRSLHDEVLCAFHFRLLTSQNFLGFAEWISVSVTLLSAFGKLKKKTQTLGVSKQLGKGEGCVNYHQCSGSSPCHEASPSTPLHTSSQQLQDASGMLCCQCLWTTPEAWRLEGAPSQSLLGFLSSSTLAEVTQTSSFIPLALPRHLPKILTIVLVISSLSVGGDLRSAMTACKPSPKSSLLLTGLSHCCAHSKCLMKICWACR